MPVARPTKYQKQPHAKTFAGRDGFGDPAEAFDISGKSPAALPVARGPILSAMPRPAFRAIRSPSSETGRFIFQRRIRRSEQRLRIIS